MNTYNPLDPNELRRQGGMVLERMARYWEEVKTLKPIPDVQPGFLEKLMPKEAPDDPESMEDIIKELDEIILPGITNWLNPLFCTYFPIGVSVPSICGDMMSVAMSIIGLSWEACPSSTELEMLMMKWLGRLLGLPEHFYEGAKGGGIIHTSSEDSTIIAVVCARSIAVKNNTASNPTKMVAYFTEETNSGIKRIANVMLIQSREVGVDENGSMCAELLEEQIQQDLADGFFPIICVATLGTTSKCSFDKLHTLGPICEKYDMWLHVDAAYAGCAFVCPEYRYLMKGIEYVDTISVNPHKWLMTNLDCSALWFKDRSYVIDCLKLESLLLEHEYQSITWDYRNWQVSLSKRFISLKLWFVLRMVGAEGLRKRIRKDVRLAKLFESLVRQDNDFEVINEVLVGLVCFRLKSGNEETLRLGDEIKKDKRLCLTKARTGNRSFLRCVICSPFMEEKDIYKSWKIIKEIHEEKKMLES